MIKVMVEFGLIRVEIYDHEYVFVELRVNQEEVVDHIVQVDE